MHWATVYYISTKDKTFPIDRNETLSLLDSYESERFNRFAFEHLKLTFATTRWLIKTELAKLLNCEPRDISFEYNENGKPFLRGVDIEFSLAHTENAIVVALSDQPIGIDVELQFRRGNPWQDADKFLNKAVANELATLPSEREQIAGFSRYWTSMEAVVKLKGSTLFKEKGAFGRGEPVMSYDGEYENQERFLYTSAFSENEQISICQDKKSEEYTFFEYKNSEFTKAGFFGFLNT